MEAAQEPETTQPLKDDSARRPPRIVRAMKRAVECAAVALNSTAADNKWMRAGSVSVRHPQYVGMQPPDIRRAGPKPPGVVQRSGYDKCYVPAVRRPRRIERDVSLRDARNMPAWSV